MMSYMNGPIFRNQTYIDQIFLRFLNLFLCIYNNNYTLLLGTMYTSFWCGSKFRKEPRKLRETLKTATLLCMYEVFDSLDIPVDQFFTS